MISGFLADYFAIILNTWPSCVIVSIERAWGYPPGASTCEVNMKKYLSLAIAAITVTLAATPAFAQQLSDTVNNLSDNISVIPILLNYAAYIIGIALLIAGFSKLKAHVDNPGQTPIKDGLGRIAAGILFLSLPFVVTLARDTMAVTGGTASFQAVYAMAT
jgi:hypothetical protein